MSNRDQLTNALLPCPFCGHRVHTQDPLDTIYPVGVTPPNRPPSMWRVVCQANAGGCDAEAYGTSPEEAAEKWNRRKQQPPLEAALVAQNVELQEALDWIGASCVKSVLAPGHYLISQVELDSAMKALDGPWPQLPGTVLRVTGRVWQRSEASSGKPGGEWVLELRATSNDVFVESRHTEPITTPLTDVIGLPSLYRPWISVKTRPPTSDAPVMVAYKSAHGQPTPESETGWSVIEARYSGGHWRFLKAQHQTRNEHRILFWQPKPLPPDGRDEP